MRGLFLLVIFGVSAAAADLEDEARQILAARCGGCHSEAAMGGLRLDTEAGFQKGGKSGKPTRELLLMAVRGGGDGIKAMPPGARLKPEDVATLEKWVAAGAKFPAGHWAWQPLKAAQGSIDAHVEAAWKSVQPAPIADHRTLVRRIAFDLTGMPPKAADLEDQKPGWQGRIVDRLLASQRFGEHWGRHWLDVARYGEDDFSGTQVQPYANAWRYRDWVVAAVNRNEPYDRFLKLQLAGDLMDGGKEVGGLGLMGLGPWYYGIAQPPQARADERHDRVDMVSRGMMGVTLACARCHDHKYDPLSQKDYYGLSGVFASTAYREHPLVNEAEVQAWTAKKKKLDEAEKALKEYLEQEAERLRDLHAPGMWRYMVATLKATPDGLDLELYNRWCEYLKRPEDNHPFLKEWFANPGPEAAQRFEKLMLEIAAEKKRIDAENKVTVEAAKLKAPKPKRTIVLPGGYRSDEDFNPGADVPVKSLERDRYVAYNRTFLEGRAPLRFPPELIKASKHQELKAERDRLEKELGKKYAYLDVVSEFEGIDLPLDRRGNPEDPSDIVERRFPIVLGGGKLTSGSGRMELAEKVARHPLTARVAVNRMWMHLFGEGIVRTPSNFGVAGDRPGNAALLEYLAARFVDLRFDTKAMIREIVLSQAYQRSSNGTGDNRLWTRQNRRRLGAEALRDAMLAVAGTLDETVGGPSEELKPTMRRRTVYAKVGRFEANETLSLFDHPNAAVTCEQRVVTNVPLQKLFYLNSEMVAVTSQALGKRMEQMGIEKGYEAVFQRPPSRTERAAAEQFLKEGGSWAQYAQVLLATNEFAYVD